MPIEAIITEAPGYRNFVMQSRLFNDVFNWQLSVRTKSGGKAIPTNSGWGDSGKITVSITTLGRDDTESNPDIFHFIAKFMYDASGPDKWQMYYIIGELNITTRGGFCTFFTFQEIKHSAVFRALFHPS